MEDEIWKMLVKSSVLVKLLFEGCVVAKQSLGI